MVVQFKFLQCVPLATVDCVHVTVETDSIHTERTLRMFIQQKKRSDVMSEDMS